MIQKTLLEIKQKIERLDSIEEAQKMKLVELFSTLQQEIERIARSDREVAESIVNFARTSAHEATRKERRAHLHRLSLDGFATSAQGFERSHPKLVETVNSICIALSNLGI